MVSLEEIKLVFDVAFAEGGKGLLYLSIGVAIGLVGSVVSLVLLAVLTTKKNWPYDSSWGKWARRAFLIYAIVTLPLGCAAVGATWGTLSAVKQTMDSQGIIKKPVQKGLDPMIVMLYLNLENEADFQNLDSAAKYDAVTEFIDSEKTIEVTELKEAFDSIMEKLDTTLVESIKEDLPFEDEGVASYVVEKVFQYLAEKELNEVKSQFAELLSLVNQESSQLVPSQISSVIYEAYIKSHIDSEYKRYKKAVVIVALLQVLISVGLPFMILHFLAYLAARKKKSAEANQEGEEKNLKETV